METKVGMKVISESDYSKGMEGVVNKVSHLGIHVKFWDSAKEEYLYEIFRHNPTHFLHTHIDKLKYLTPAKTFGINK